MSPRTASDLLREARRTASLSQRELAARAGTAQSVVARIENGQTDPGYSTLLRLLAAADFEMEALLIPRSDRKVALKPSYLMAVAWAEQRPANQPGSDKSWVEKADDEARAHFESAVMVR